MNRFYTTSTDALDTANYLYENGYEENDSFILKDNEDEPIQILIDKEDKVFCFIDNEGLRQQKSAKLIHSNEIIETITFKELQSWQN